MVDEPDGVVRDFLTSFLTDPNSGSRPAGHAYVVSNWPVVSDLVFNDYPRISVVRPQESQKPFGLGGSTMFQTIRLQIDVWAKPDVLFTIGGTVYEGSNLVRKISRDIEEAIKNNYISSLLNTNKFLLMQYMEMYKPHRDYDKNLWRVTMTVTFNKINT